MSGVADHDDAMQVPRWALIAAGCLVSGTIALATISSLGAKRVAMPQASAPITALRFDQNAAQALIVTNAVTGKQVAFIAPTADAFLRTTLRTMIETRISDGITRTAPFLLIPTGKDDLVLDDPATGQKIDLQAFGPSNSVQFQNLTTKGQSS